ncbi:synaptotagmin-2-like [Bidens hawaiensis]|uniref:synaptotagmin-2-like n=1 Tax=Bidens hawaiensis TaxID=980011 RepID=UPI00404B2BA5
MFSYENADEEAVYGDGILNLKVLKKEDEGNKNQFKVPDNSYLILDMGDRQTVKCGWDEVVTLYVEEFHHQWLNVFLNKVESVEKHRHLGMAIFRLSDLTSEIPVNWSDMIWMNINGWFVGNITVEVLYKAMAYTRIPTVSRSIQKAPVGTPKDGGLLVIIIHRADLSHVKHKHSSVTLLFHGELRKTPTMMSTTKPIWLQEFTFILEQPPTDEHLHIEVNDDSWMGLIPGKVQ